MNVVTGAKKTQFLRVVLFLSFFITMAGFCQGAVMIRVTGDNVNLRSAPTNTSEIVGQVSTGDRLVTTGATGGWMQVVPPETIDLWIYAEFAPEGKVAVSKLQVRSGPGINYKAVAVLKKGDKVKTRGTRGEWLQIEPPVGSAVWISSKYSEIIKPKPDIPPLKRISSEDIERKPPKPSDGKRVAGSKQSNLKTNPSAKAIPRKQVDTRQWTAASKLLKDAREGGVVKRSGTIKPAGMVWRRPSEYRLVVFDKWNRAVTICYVIGSQLEALEGKDVYLVGREYWIQGVRYPVVVADQLQLND